MRSPQVANDNYLERTSPLRIVDAGQLFLIGNAHDLEELARHQP